MDSGVIMTLFLLLLSACIYYAKSHESGCMYQYLEQPPLDIVCDPYNSESTGLSLQCQVLALNPSSSYRVGWFYYPTNHNVEIEDSDIVQPIPISVTSTITDNINSTTSTTTATLTLRPLVDGSGPGFYYCQVLPVDQSETIPSDNFTLYAPEDNHYLTFIICESMKPRFKSEVKCAVPTGDDPLINITGIQPPQNDGNPVDITTGNVIATTTTNAPAQGDQTVDRGTTLPATEVINDPTTVACAKSEGSSKAMLYQVYVYVLTPIFLVILIVLITIVAAYLGRKCVCRRSREQQQPTKENRIRDGQAGQGGLNQLRQSFHRVLRMQRWPTPQNSSPLSSLDLQPNPSYLENSRNTALLQSRTCQASPLLETHRQTPIQKPDACRQDISRQEEEGMFSINQGSITSYEDNSYVIMRSSGTNSTYQSSGAYESML